MQSWIYCVMTIMREKSFRIALCFSQGNTEVEVLKARKWMDKLAMFALHQFLILVPIYLPSCLTTKNKLVSLILGFILSCVIPKTLKLVSACFSCFNAQHLRVAQTVKKQAVDYTSVKKKLIQSWRYKTLAVIKRHKNHLSFYPHI